MADSDSDLASRVEAWFANNDGRTLMIDIGTYAEDRDPPERTLLTITSPVAVSTNSEAFTEPTIIVANSVERENHFDLMFAPARLSRAIFGRATRDALELYFDDGAYINLLVSS